MNEKELFELINSIKPLDKETMENCDKRQQSLAKPPGSLGSLEDFTRKICGITGNVFPTMKKKRVVVFAADNGVVAENISSCPQNITTIQCINMTRHKTGMSALAKSFGDEVMVVDVGVNSSLPSEITNKKIRYGTGNILKEEAMTREEVISALCVGIEMAKAAKDDKVDALGIGEMGIGNTTTSSAVLSLLLNVEPKVVTGYGGGLTDEGLKHKIEVIEKSISFHKPDTGDVLDILSKVGGLDIAAMTGCFIGCGIYRVPVVCDGFISIVAALCAQRLNDKAKDYMFLSHASVEPGYLMAAKALDLETPLNLHMRLGEGSGCVVMFRILESAIAAYTHMATFDEGNIEDDFFDSVRESGFADKR